MNLGTLIEGLPAAMAHGNPGVEVTGVTKDSRAVQPGFLFFVTPASEPYLGEALGRGACAVVSERPPGTAVPNLVITADGAALLGKVASRINGVPSRRLSVTGITGTNGKTTTTYLMESILRAGGKKCGVIGTILYRYDGHEVKAPTTTPGADELQGLLAAMVRAGVEHAVMEVSSHALHQKRVEGVEFDTAVFTNLTRDHLDYHGTVEAYRDAKALFFHHYLRESPKEHRRAVINLDDPAAQGFVPAPPVETLFYSLTHKAHGHVIRYEETIEGLRAEISLHDMAVTLRSPLLGIFNVSNILAASLSAISAHLPLEAVKKGVESLPGVPGRLERVSNDRGVFAFVDYAHTPDALAKVLDLLNRLKRKRLILVFGCGGDRDKGKRPLMGEIASRMADFSIITSDNPRSEVPSRIIEDIARGFSGNSFRVVEDRRAAIREACAMARPDDVLLVAGKGHEDYQIIGQETHHFSDQEEIGEGFGVAGR